MKQIETIPAGELAPELIRRFLSEAAAAYPVEVGSPDLTDWPEKLAAHATTFCIRRSDGSLEAALFAYLNDETKVGYVPFFCVLPLSSTPLQTQFCTSQRPKGTAYHLHGSYRHAAEQRGLSLLQLEVLQTNTHAIAFYERQGYTITENRTERNRYLLKLPLYTQCYTHKVN